MPTTRKKIVKTVYKDDEDSEDLGEDFSDSGSEAEISPPPSSDEEEHDEVYPSSSEEFKKTPKNKSKIVKKKKPQFAKAFINKINKQSSADNEDDELPASNFSVKDLTEANKLLPSVLNLSESDSSDDESPKPAVKKDLKTELLKSLPPDLDDNIASSEYTDVWSTNEKDASEEIAKKTFLELELHKEQLEKAKLSMLNYTYQHNVNKNESEVKDLLALGEEIEPSLKPNTKKKRKKAQDQSDSEVEDWEEVKESKSIPQQGLQLIVDLPHTVSRKTKKVDVEMMMKRKMNRVKKEHQVYMHKVHVLCWLGHGNYISTVLNDQEVMAAALKLVPSKECYPGERVDIKYVEQITTWYKEKMTWKQDKNEGKFRPKAPPLKDILLQQMKNRTLTSKKYVVYIFVAMLRAIGLQCRIMLNFLTVPIRPPASELHSLSTKTQDGKHTKEPEPIDKKASKMDSKISKLTKKISQLDGNDDSMESSSDFEDIMQLDGNNDLEPNRTRSTRSNTAQENKKNLKVVDEASTETVSPPKRAKKSDNAKAELKESNEQNPPKKTLLSQQRKQSNVKTLKEEKTNSEKNVTTGKKNKNNLEVVDEASNETVSPPKRAKKIVNIKTESNKSPEQNLSKEILSLSHLQKKSNVKALKEEKTNPVINVTPRNSRVRILKNNSNSASDNCEKNIIVNNMSVNPPKIVVSKTKENITSSKFFTDDQSSNKLKLLRKRSATTNPSVINESKKDISESVKHTKTRAKSTPSRNTDKSKYFNDDTSSGSKVKPVSKKSKEIKDLEKDEDKLRVSHKDLLKQKTKNKDDVTLDLVQIIKKRVKEAKADVKNKVVKGKHKEISDEDSDYLPEEDAMPTKGDSDDDFKPVKISPKPSTSRKSIKKIVHVQASEDENASNGNKIDVWCEVFVEELEEWVAVDVIRSKVHCVNEIYSKSTHPITYVVGWDNNKYLKDLTRRYVCPPLWNTVTRKQRAEFDWWNTAVQPWLGPKTPRDREEDERLDRMQLEAPLPKSITEYKNHPLYALKRHLLKFEAIYPPDAVTLGFVRGEAVYARDCVYVCRSRDTWLKEAKVVKLGEQPYKVVKARPKWDKLSNKLITDKPLEVFGPWQVQDYEPPIAENGIVPRNAYGNVELFKECMLPKGTVHVKLPGLNRVAKKLNIDCAPAMTGFDFNGGWSHPVFDGFVVCQEYEEIIKEAWVKDQEELERREREKIDARVYGNWKKLIRGLLIRERLKMKYGFEHPSTSESKKKPKGPRLVVKKTK